MIELPLDHKNFGRLTEGFTITIGIGVAITISGLIAFGLLLFVGVPWFTIPLIFVFLGMWIATNQWNELNRLRIVAGFVASITHPTRITTTANLLNMKRHTFVHALTKLITRGAVEISIFPEVDTFGPKGCKRPNSVPKDYQPPTPIPITSRQQLSTILQWIGLIGTIIAIVYHIIGLLRYLGFF
ncbi:MAG: hypothetical protein ACFFBR_10040 [Promethearchaeota archaeon]